VTGKGRRVLLRARVEPVVLDYARAAANVANMEFSKWVERAVCQVGARESAYRAMVASDARGECGKCGQQLGEECACERHP
jgi:hypothetical protein